MENLWNWLPRFTRWPIFEISSRKIWSGISIKMRHKICLVKGAERKKGRVQNGVPFVNPQIRRTVLLDHPRLPVLPPLPPTVLQLVHRHNATTHNALRHKVDAATEDGTTNHATEIAVITITRSGDQWGVPCETVYRYEVIKNECSRILTHTL